MRIGLIGVGRIGVFHASTLRGLPGVDSLIITDADTDRACQVAGEFGAQTAESVTELLGTGVDALVIAAPTGTHPDLIRRGVQAGVPVFFEKPVAPDVEGTLDVIKSTSARLRMDDGTLAVVNCGRHNDAGCGVRLEVLGSAGSVCAGLDDRMALRSAEPGESFPAGPAHREFMGRFGDAYVAELAAFIDVAAGQAASPCTVEDAREAFYVAEACELSRHRQQPVLVAEARQ